MIARTRLAKHLFIDGTFHHPIGYSRLLIVLFKDIVSFEYLPGYYILMSNKTEILYDLVFKSFKMIINKNKLYQLDIETITTNIEIA